MSAAASVAAATSLRAPAAAPDPDAPIRRVAEQIEGLFLREVLKVMRDTVPESNLMQGGLAGEFYGGMLDEELSTRAGSTGGLGLADAIAEQLGASRRPGPGGFERFGAARGAAPGFAPLSPGLAATRYQAAADRWVHPLADRPALPRGEGARFGAARSGGARTHMGVDLAAPLGTPVRSVARGTVEKVERDGDSGRAGRYVRIAHSDGVVSRYIHLDEIRGDLVPGTTVSSGELLGTVGRTGVRNSGTHLHFTLSQRSGGPGTPESYIDPEASLEAWNRGISLPPPQIGTRPDDRQIMGGP